MHSFNFIIVTTGIIISAFSRKENTHMQVKSHEKLTLMITLFKYYIHGNLDVNDKHKLFFKLDHDLYLLYTLTDLSVLTFRIINKQDK